MSANENHLALLRYISTYMATHNRAPSQPDIRDHFEIAPSTVAYRIQALVRHGWLVAGGGIRKMSITDKGRAMLASQSGSVPAMPATAARYVVRSYGGVPFTIELDCANTRERRRVLDALIAGGFSVREVARGDDVRRKSGAA